MAASAVNISNIALVKTDVSDVRIMLFEDAVEGRIIVQSFVVIVLRTLGELRRLHVISANDCTRHEAPKPVLTWALATCRHGGKY